MLLAVKLINYVKKHLTRHERAKLIESANRVIALWFSAVFTPSDTIIFFGTRQLSQFYWATHNWATNELGNGPGDPPY